MRNAITILLASVSAIAMGYGAMADEPEQPTHIKVVKASPLMRTDVIGVIGEPTIFELPKGQSIYRVVQTGKISDNAVVLDADWQMPGKDDTKETPLGNVLPMWPARVGQTTMAIITVPISCTISGDTISGDCTQTVYPFRLVAIPSDAAALTQQNVSFNVKLEDVGSPAKRSATVAPAAPSGGVSAAVWQVRQKARKADQDAAAERIRVDAFNGVSGCHYHPQGKRPSAIEPRCPLDNGQWTLMRFPGLSKKPAVYVLEGDNYKDERLARQHGAGDFIVVEEIAKHFRLWLGADVLDIINDAYDPAGKPTGGTITPTVERQIIQAKATH